MKILYSIVFLSFILAGLWDGLYAQKANSTIRPDGAIKPKLTHRKVDLTGCLWVDFKSSRYQIRMDRVGGDHEITIEDPGIADCATDK